MKIERIGTLSNENIDVEDIKNGNQKLIFSLFQRSVINTVEVETKAFRFAVSQKCSIKRDIELLVAIHHIWDVSILPA